MKKILVIVGICLVAMVFVIEGLAITKPLSAPKNVVCGQRTYLKHGAKFWYKTYYRIKHGQIRANINLQKKPARFRKKGCPRSIWKGHGPEYWHYKAAVLTAKARARKIALEYETRPARAARVALKFVGTWYVWGGNRYPPGFDCSGLVQFAYSQVGISLPRTTFYQRFVGKHVPVEYGYTLKVGDILFFHWYSHEAMYIGNGLMIEAPRTGATVRVTPVRNFDEARRVVG